MLNPVVTAALTALLLAAPAVGSPWQEQGPVTSRIVFPSALPAGGTAVLGFQVRLDAGWHVYWKNSGDAGLPPEVTVEAAPPLGSVEVLFPAPERFTVAGGLEALGYQDEILYPVRVHVPDRLEGAVALSVAVDFLACEVDCIPFRQEAEAELPVVAGGGERVAPEAVPWLARLPAPVVSTTLHARATRSGEEVILGLSGRGLDGSRSQLFVEPVPGVEVGRIERSPSPGLLRFVVPVKPAVAGDPLPEPLVVAWTATRLGGSGVPQAVSGTSTVSRRPGKTGSLLRPEGALPAAPSAARLFLAGLLLAFSPSVLTLLLLEARGAHGSERRTLGRESFVWPSTAGALGGFVAVALAVHAASSASGAGSASNSPWVLSLLGPFHLVLALFLWLAPERVAAFGPSAGRSVALGAVAPVLALPWVALSSPAAGLLAGRTSALLAPVAAVGFALPFALAAAAAAVGSRRAGGDSLRALGFLPMVTLIWIAYQLDGDLPGDRLAGVELAWLAVALGVRVGATAATRWGRWAGWVVGVVGAAAAPLLAL